MHTLLAERLCNEEACLKKLIRCRASSKFEARSDNLARLVRASPIVCVRKTSHVLESQRRC